MGNIEFDQVFMLLCPRVLPTWARVARTMAHEQNLEGLAKASAATKATRLAKFVALFK